MSRRYAGGVFLDEGQRDGWVKRERCMRLPPTPIFGSINAKIATNRCFGTAKVTIDAYRKNIATYAVD